MNRTITDYKEEYEKSQKQIASLREDLIEYRQFIMSIGYKSLTSDQLVIACKNFLTIAGEINKDFTEEDVDEAMDFLNRASLLSDEDINKYWGLLSEILNYVEYGSSLFSYVFKREIVREYDLIKDEFDVVEELIGDPPTLQKVLKYKSY